MLPLECYYHYYYEYNGARDDVSDVRDAVSDHHIKHAVSDHQETM